MKYSVDIEGGNAFVEKIKKKAPNIGGFNGMMRIPKGYANPVLISGTDGVGTKINIAKIARDYTTIGEDLVAMCVNDVICSGAKPLYFLDYISTGKIDQDILGQVMQGILKGCEIADMQLLGGETAEHPKVGGKGSSADMDLAGFCRNCLSKWYREEAQKKGIEISDPEARRRVYGMPYDEYKLKHQKVATKEQLEKFNENKQK